jgi:hypothetical protein
MEFLPLMPSSEQYCVLCALYYANKGKKLRNIPITVALLCLPASPLSTYKIL